jgi:hypothetical protein
MGLDGKYLQTENNIKDSMLTDYLKVKDILDQLMDLHMSDNLSKELNQVMENNLINKIYNNTKETIYLI